jgi:hypothetical protein
MNFDALNIRAFGCLLLRNLLKFLRHPMRDLVLLGVVIRLILAPLTGWPDTYAFWRESMQMLADPRAVVYQYPPLWFLTVFSFVKPLTFFSDPSSFAVSIPELGKMWYTTGAYLPVITSPAFNFALKLPWILSDLATGAIIWSILKSQKNAKVARKGFVFWFLNPLVILVSSVMGQSESIIALFALASLYLVIRGRYLSSGVSLGLSIFFKTYNAFLSVFFLLFVFLLSKNAASNDKASMPSPNVVPSMKFLCGIAFPFLVLLPSMEFYGFGETYLTMVSSPSFSGFNIWFINRIPSAKWILDWAYSNSDFLLKSLLLIYVASVIVISCIVIFSDGKLLVEKIIQGSVYILGITFLLMPWADPHRLVLILPFLILAIMLYGRFSLRFHLLWSSAFVFILSIWGAAFLFYPLAVFSPLLSVETINQATLAYWYIPGIVNQKASWDLMLFSSGLGFTVLLSFFLPFEKLRNRLRRVRKTAKEN